MDDRRRAHAMTDAAVDAEIRRALAVEPSPEFVARVRTRIASEPAPSAWRISWSACFVGAAVAAIVLATVLVSRQRSAITAAPPLSSRLLASIGQLPAARGSTGSPRATFAFGRASSVPARPELVEGRAAHGEAAQPAVDAQLLIDVRETNALQALIAGVHERRVDLSPLLQPPAPAPMELPPISDIVIPPITIDPLAPADGAEGVRQR